MWASPQQVHVQCITADPVLYLMTSESLKPGEWQQEAASGTSSTAWRKPVGGINKISISTYVSPSRLKMLVTQAVQWGEQYG